MRRALTLAVLLFGVSAHAQMSMSGRTLMEAEMQHGSSGTSIEPASTPVPMLMTQRGAGPNRWMLMLHSNAFAAETQQQASSHRGRDGFFSTNWIMPMAQRRFGAGGRGGQMTLRTMLSLEPATVGHHNYPELFQQGETAFGTPIIDGQHPHDFFMEVAALYDLPVRKDWLLSLYAAPVGDPAIGPTAYPHRQSASEDPIAALGHHQQDSTHIAFNVVTGGLTWRWARAELSGFHGGEPEEAHWHFEPSVNGHNMDSVATRLTVCPTPDWSGQYSIAHITAPEATSPHEDQQRQTASIMYHHTFRVPVSVDAHRPVQPAPATSGTMDDMGGMSMADMPGMNMDDRAPTTALPHTSPKMAMTMNMVTEPRTDFAATLLWGRTRSLTDSGKENSYLAEALLRFSSRNYVWTRLENAGRSTELLRGPGSTVPAGFSEGPIGHVAAFTLGYDRDYRLGKRVLAAPGAQITLYRTPHALRAIYGDTPTGEVLFVRFRLR